MTAAQELLGQALGRSTQAAYQRAWRAYREFLDTYNFPFVFPAGERTIFLFIAQMQSRHYSPSTIASYVSALSYIHKVAGHPDPTDSFLIRKSLQAARRISPTYDSRLPITEEILHRLISGLSCTISTQYRKALYRSMFLLAFHAFLRVGEVTRSEHTLQFEDVTQIGSKIQIRFRTAKHSAGHIQTVNVQPVSPKGFCPVEAWQEYIRLRGNHTGPLYSWNGSAVVRQEFVQVLKCTLSAIGIKAERFNSHSFRIGAATSCAEKGASDAQIRRLGRWKSDAFKRYIRSPNPLQPSQS